MRGTGSLQSLLGRSNFTSGTKRKKHEASEVKAPDVAPDARSDSPGDVEDGSLRCPVCKKPLQMSFGDNYINTHIGMLRKKPQGHSLLQRL